MGRSTRLFTISPALLSDCGEDSVASYLTCPGFNILTAPESHPCRGGELRWGLIDG